MYRLIGTTGLTIVLGGLALTASQHQPGVDPPWQAFIAAGGADARQREQALTEIAGRWRNGYAAMLVDLARFLPSPRNPALESDSPFIGVDDDPNDDRSGASRREGFTTPRPPLPGADVRRRLTAFLEQQTRKRFGDDLRAWRRWYWSLPYAPHPDYASFKAEVYARVDPRFRGFFPPRVKTRIRLDEVDWGGVPVNGIPPLRLPKAIAARDAGWLRDGHIVFGIQINGEARAYPKRILAWHEMAIDRLGGIDLTIVYCTLCGAVIPYESAASGRRFTFGTSGLLYRSNKLMFDEETLSLWSSLEGVPVIGPLAESGIRLPFRSVVTTTWGEWKRDHPSTTVLSLDTGYERDYAEGAAYRNYFATDRLMFEVPTADTRLKNKAEVLVLRPDVIGKGASPVAIAVERLRATTIYPFEANGRRLVVVTSRNGANVVYERGSHLFIALDSDGRIRDSRGQLWTAREEALVSAEGERIPRVPAHRAFWFAWVAQYPDTLLLK